MPFLRSFSSIVIQTTNHVLTEFAANMIVFWAKTYALEIIS